MPRAARLTPGRTRAPRSATITKVPTNGVSRDDWPRDPGEQLPQPSGSEHHVRPSWTARTLEQLIRLVVSRARQQRKRDQRHLPRLLPRDPEHPLDSTVASLIHQQERDSDVRHKQPDAGDVPERDVELAAGHSSHPRADDPRLRKRPRAARSPVSSGRNRFW
jgi:hypothetical protein